MNTRKDHFITKVLLLALCLAMALTGAAMAAASDEEVQHMSCAIDDGLDSAACFEAYIADMFGMGATTYAQRKVGNSFTGDLRIFYDFLSECIREVAAGTRTSTEFIIEHGFTLDGSEMSDLLSALLADHPYELYWFDKVAGYAVSYGSTISAFSFSVNAEYAAGEYEVNPAAVKSAQAAVARAESIVSQYASASDYEKLVGYRKAICDLVAYNDDAAGNSVSSDSNAWQLVWVFDGDDSTKVVCEGYAKAFQYLCDRTDFAGDVCCYSVTGYMGTYTGGGAHMWNLVRMPNGGVYLVDVTNCDAGTVGADDLLFMAGYDSGNAMDGYVFRCNYGSGYYEDVMYAYDLSMWDIFATDDLNVSDTDYLDDDITPVGLIISAYSFPDDVFRAYISDGFDGDGDGGLSDAELLAVKVIDVTGMNINSLMGIENFAALEKLYCGENRLASLDVSGNGALAELDCSGNLLTDLNISANIRLEKLDCSENRLSSLDIYGNTALKDLSLSGNRISKLCIRGNAHLFAAIDSGNCEKYDGYSVYAGETGRLQVDNAVELVIETCAEHVSVTDAAVAPTCTEDGYTAGSHCSVCGEVIVPQTVIPARGHVISVKEDVYVLNAGESMTAPEVTVECGHAEKVSVKWNSSHEDRLAVSGTTFTAKAAGAVTVTAVTDDAFKTACAVRIAVHGDRQMILPENLTDIEAEAFMNSGAQEYVLPDGLITIGERAFEGCKALVIVNIPDSVADIGADAFKDCPQLTVLCGEGSYGMKYAESNGIPYIVIPEN